LRHGRCSEGGSERGPNRLLGYTNPSHLGPKSRLCLPAQTRDYELLGINGHPALVAVGMPGWLHWRIMNASLGDRTKQLSISRSPTGLHHHERASRGRPITTQGRTLPPPLRGPSQALPQASRPGPPCGVRFGPGHPRTRGARPPPPLRTLSRVLTKTSPLGARDSKSAPRDDHMSGTHDSLRLA
jgi:hypothetical protein